MIIARKELEPLKGKAIVSEALRYAHGFFTAYPQRISLILILMVLQTLTAGIGILFILPLLSVLGLAGEAASNHAITRTLSEAFSGLGIPLSLLPMLILYILLVTFVATLRSFTMIVSTKVQQQYTHKIRSDMYQLVMRARWRELSTYTLADLGYLLSGQLSQVGRLSQLVLQFTSQVILAVGFFIVALLVSWQMSLVALTFVAVSSVLLLPLYRRVLASGSTQLRANQRLFKAVTEHLHSLRMIKLFGAESQFASALVKTSKSLERQQVRLTKMNAMTQWVLTVMAVVLVSSFFYVSIAFVGSELAELVVLVVILARLLPLLSSLQKTVQQALHSLPASAGANEMAQRLQQVQEPRVALGAQTHLQQSLALCSVDFRYPDTEDAVLTNFSCNIPVNQVVAITGPSGSGKSTVADLLAGLQLPDAGTLLLDGNALRDDALMSWRHSVAYVVQEPLLFNDTIRNNLLWVRKHVSETDMEKALRDAAAWDFVHSLPKGLDTMVGDHGRQLSGGQRQRIAIARALLREPQLLILDEATNALDQANEALVKETIVNLRGKLTVVVISHQASINDLADHVIDLGEREKV